MYQEYPKWIRHPGKAEVLVDNADAEAAQRKAWGDLPAAVPSQRNALLQPAQDDGSTDIAALRIEYKEKTGKRAFPGWDADEIRARMATAA